MERTKFGFHSGFDSLCSCMSFKIRKSSPFWSAHSHSHYSYNDALPTVQAMVDQVVKLNQPALALTDHGNMAGAVDLYKASDKAGIKPFPGTELYVVRDREDSKAKRYHMGVMAYTTKGYENLVRLNSLANKNFHNKPILDLGDFAEMHENGLTEGIAATSGCYFGMVNQAIVRGDEEDAKALLRCYDKWFPKFYIELQNHKIDHNEEDWDDNALADALVRIADELGIPCVLTQDSHYVNLSEKPAHEALKRLVSWSADPDEATFPGDGFHLADEEWMHDHHPARWEKGIEGLQDLLGAHDLRIPELDSYRYNIPFTVDDPQRTLEERTRALLIEIGKSHSSYLERLEDELEIIRDTGMAGYLLLVAEVTDWCQVQGVVYQARGSASGSMVCWLLSITSADPIRWDLKFERFISRDRTKPPDIDLDIEHSRRRELVDFLSARFTVHQIGTWNKYSLTEDEDDEEEAKGSLMRKYYGSLRKQDKEVGNWGDIPEDDQQQLLALSDGVVYSSYGTHAAGMVLTTNAEDFNRIVPMMYIASSKTNVTQYGMNQVEAMGLVKLDVLGLRTLSVLHKCMDNLGKDIQEGLSWIPLNDKKTLARISSGNTSGVFQLEGGTARYGCKELKPTHIEDIIAAMALFRPAIMQSGGTQSYIKRKHRLEVIPKRHELLSKFTGSTYGISLYQEQIISIIRELGFSPDDLTLFLKAVKASNASIGDAAAIIDGYKSKIHGMCTAIEMNEIDFDWLWGAIEGFASYSFNRSHSVVYGITAYQCAYLAAHHPLEFYAALLSVAAGTKKEAPYLTTVRRADIRIQRADINESDFSYSMNARKTGIRKGLLAIKGIGAKTAQEIVDKRPEGGYEDLRDMCMRVNRRIITGANGYLQKGDLEVGVIGKLYDNGCLDSLLKEQA